MSRILVSANEVALAAGIGNSTTVDNARAVRVFNNSGAEAVVYLTDSAYSGIGSVTMKDGITEILKRDLVITFTIQEVQQLELQE